MLVAAPRLASGGLGRIVVEVVHDAVTDHQVERLRGHPGGDVVSLVAPPLARVRADVDRQHVQPRDACAGTSRATCPRRHPRRAPIGGGRPTRHTSRARRWRGVPICSGRAHPRIAVEPLVVAASKRDMPLSLAGRHRTDRADEIGEVVETGSTAEHVAIRTHDHASPTVPSPRNGIQQAVNSGWSSALSTARTMLRATTCAAVRRRCRDGG